MPQRAPWQGGLRAGAWLLALLLGAGQAAATDAHALLERMNRALHELDYVGTLVYAERGRIESMRVFHAADEGGERERLVALTGEPREIVRENGRVTCIGSTVEPRSYAATLPSVSATRFSGELPQYELIVGETARIAGRDAQQVEIRARDAFRYSYRLWIDRDSGLLLKSLRYGADGSTIDQLMFTDVEIGRQPAESELQASANAQPVSAAPASPTRAAPPSARWSVRDLPPGFALASLSHGSEGSEEHQVYSDGLASVSVYIETPGSNDGAPASTTRGAISVFARQHDGFRVYVIGDVPERTAQRIAQGVVASRDGSTGSG